MYEVQCLGQVTLFVNIKNEDVTIRTGIQIGHLHNTVTTQVKVVFLVQKYRSVYKKNINNVHILGSFDR